MLGFGEGRTENGVFAGNLSFRGKKGSPAPPPKKAAFTRSAPRRAGQAAYGKDAAGDEERRTGGFWRGNLSFWGKKGSPAPLPKKAAFMRSAPRRAGQAAELARPPHPPWGGRAFRLSWGERERGLLSPERRPLSQKNKSAIILQSGFPRARILRPRSDPRPGFHRCS